MSSVHTSFERRKNRVRFRLKKIYSAPGAKRMRLSVHCSSAHFYAQVIDDASGSTMVSASTLELRSSSGLPRKGVTVELVRKVGQMLAERAKSKNLQEVFLDRGGRRYHGRIRSFAEAARESGLIF